MAWSLQQLKGPTEVSNCGGLHRINYQGTNAIRGTTKINGVIAPARVMLMADTGQRIGFRVTGSNGEYAFEGLAPGDYTLVVSRNSDTDVRSKVEHVRIQPSATAPTIYGFDPSYKHAGIQLSENDTVATRVLASSVLVPENNEYMTVRSVVPVFNMQYFEFHIGVIPANIPQLMMLGVASADTLTTEHVAKRAGSAGENPESHGLWFVDSNYYNGFSARPINQKVVGCAIGSSGGIFFSLNGVWGYNDPNAGFSSIVSTTGVAYPAATLYEQDTSVKIVLNARDFVYAIPPGFRARTD